MGEECKERNFYDLSNSKIKVDPQQLLDELKYNPMPYDLGFSFKLSKIGKGNANN